MRFVLISALLAVFVVGWQPAVTGAAPQQAPADSKVATPAPINLNTATAEQLQKLPGIGPRTASRIIEYRQKTGGFKKIEELMNVRGVGEKSFLKIKSQITVAPAKADIP